MLETGWLAVGDQALNVVEGTQLLPGHGVRQAAVFTPSPGSPLDF
jgi:hypothetical protein